MVVGEPLPGLDPQCPAPNWSGDLIEIRELRYPRVHLNALMETAFDPAVARPPSSLLEAHR